MSSLYQGLCAHPATRAQALVLLAMAAVFCPVPVLAGPAMATAPAVEFAHGDWQLVCDNTRTCRAAGYQRDEVGLPVSVLLTRPAGAGAAVQGRVSLGDGWDNSVLDALPARLRVGLWIDGKAHGQAAVTKDALEAELSAAQVAALLQASRRDSRIEFRAGPVVWALSDAGAAAVLLKMDEVQGRIGTVGALFRKGKQSEAQVLPALAAPTVKAAPLAAPQAGDASFVARHGKALLAALRSGTSADDCSDLHETGDDQGTLEMVRLSDARLLVSTRCWLAAYNAGSGHWIVGDSPPFRPELVSTDATDFDGGTLSATHKGRGIGDCWGSETWTWDGRAFVPSGAFTTGLCKGFAGGAWTLPTWVTRVE